MEFLYEDESEAWLRDIMENHYEEALSRVSSFVQQASADEKGCLVSDTEVPRKIRFRGRQVAAYRFIYCVLNRATLREDEVVRHRCHDRRCYRLEHLVEGSQADNRQDDWDHWSNGTDHRYL